MIKRYLEKYPQGAPIRMLTMQGTYDICHVGVKPMQERLERLGEKLVKAEYIEVSFLSAYRRTEYTFLASG